MFIRFVFHEMANVLCSQESSLKDLLTPLIKHTLSANKIDPALIGDLVIGNVLPPSSMGATEVRVAMRVTSPDACPLSFAGPLSHPLQVRIAGILGGLPKEVPVMTVNRQCSSGLQAMANVAGAIRVRRDSDFCFARAHASVIVWTVRFWPCRWR